MFREINYFAMHSILVNCNNNILQFSSWPEFEFRISSFCIRPIRLKFTAMMTTKINWHSDDDHFFVLNALLSLGFWFFVTPRSLHSHRFDCIPVSLKTKPVVVSLHDASCYQRCRAEAPQRHYAATAVVKPPIEAMVFGSTYVKNSLHYLGGRIAVDHSQQQCWSRRLCLIRL